LTTVQRLRGGRSSAGRDSLPPGTAQQASAAGWLARERDEGSGVARSASNAAAARRPRADTVAEVRDERRRRASGTRGARAAAARRPRSGRCHCEDNPRQRIRSGLGNPVEARIGSWAGRWMRFRVAWPSGDATAPVEPDPRGRGRGTAPWACRAPRFSRIERRGGPERRQTAWRLLIRYEGKRGGSVCVLSIQSGRARVLDAARWRATPVSSTGTGWAGCHGWAGDPEGLTFQDWAAIAASIDVTSRTLAGAVLVTEVKSTIPDAQVWLGSSIRKGRLALAVASGAWLVRSVEVSRALLIVPGRTEKQPRRRRVEFGWALRSERCCPLRGSHRFGAWVRKTPVGTLAGILFVSNVTDTESSSPGIGPAD